MNLVAQVGNLTADARINAEKTVAAFTLAVQRPFKNKDGNYDSDFINCKIFGEKFVTAFESVLLKGATIEIVGSFRNENYEKDGQKVYGYAIAVDKLRCIKKATSSDDSNSNENSSRPTPEAATPDGFTNIPDSMEDAGLPWQ